MYSMDTLDKEAVHFRAGCSMRVHHTIQNTVEFKIYKLLVWGNFHILFLDFLIFFHHYKNMDIIQQDVLRLHPYKAIRVHCWKCCILSFIIANFFLKILFIFICISVLPLYATCVSSAHRGQRKASKFPGT